MRTEPRRVVVTPDDVIGPGEHFMPDDEALRERIQAWYETPEGLNHLLNLAHQMQGDPT